MRATLFITFGCLALASLVQTTAAEDASQETQGRWQREDIAVFRDKFLAVDRSYGTEARAAAERRLLQLEKNSGSISPTAFVVELCQIAALADNGHTQCLSNATGRNFCRMLTGIFPEAAAQCGGTPPDFEVADFKAVPLAFYPFGDAFHVSGAADMHAELLGARLVAVDGRAIETIHAELRSFAGGTSAHRDLVVAEVLTSPEQLNAVGLSHRPDALSYDFVTAKGARVKRTFTASSSSGHGEWRQLPDPTNAPWAFQEPDKPFRFRDAADLDALVVQLRRNQDAPEQKIAEFLDKAEQTRATLGRDNVVLDMRFNGGGNLLLTRDFMRQWPARVPGKFFVLTSRQTFSAAITSIAYLEQAGGDRVIIVGEPVGDRLMFFSDGLPIRLPHSGRYFLPAIVRMDYHGGCRDYDDCFEGVAQPGRPTAAALLSPPPNMQRLPLSVETLAPDIDAPWTIESWLQSRDPMMEAVATRYNTPQG